MNMLDMHTREKVNKIHLDELHSEARNRHLLRDINSTSSPTLSKRRIRLAVIFAALVILLGTFVIISIVGF